MEKAASKWEEWIDISFLNQEFKDRYKELLKVWQNFQLNNILILAQLFIRLHNRVNFCIKLVKWLSILNFFYQNRVYLRSNYNNNPNYATSFFN